MLLSSYGSGIGHVLGGHGYGGEHGGHGDYDGGKFEHLGSFVGKHQLPPKVIRITKTIAVKVPVPYPVKVPHGVPYPVHVPKPYPVHVPKLVKVSEPVPVHIPKPVPYPVHIYHDDKNNNAASHEQQQQYYAGQNNNNGYNFGGGYQQESPSASGHLFQENTGYQQGHDYQPSYVSQQYSSPGQSYSSPAQASEHASSYQHINFGNGEDQQQQHYNTPTALHQIAAPSHDVGYSSDYNQQRLYSDHQSPSYGGGEVESYGGQQQQGYNNYDTPSASAANGGEHH